MKKILYGSILISTSALALGIDINTKIKWNSIVVVAAAHDVGLEAEDNTHPEVSSTYYRILGDLLERETFSVADAVSVCNKECNKSQFLKEGRGQSGKKCPEICKSFGEALIAENNRATDVYGYYTSYGRVYSKDKQFYVDSKDKKVFLFKSGTNKKIGEPGLMGGYREDERTYVIFHIIDPVYDGYEFEMICDEDEKTCELTYKTSSDGRVYTKDKKFYMIVGYDSKYIFESSTNKPVAMIEYVEVEGSAALKQQCKILDTRYNGYVCEGHADSVDASVGTAELMFQPAEKAQEERKSAYYNDWLDLQKCLNVYRGIDFSEIKSWLSLDVFSPMGHSERNGYKGKSDFMSKMGKFQSTSYDLYDEMKIVYRKYCPAPYSSRLVEIRQEIRDLKNYFSDTKRFAKTQTKTKQEAITKIRENIPQIAGPSFLDLTNSQPNRGSVIDISKLYCTGECHTFGQDYVTCTLGTLKAIFEFDDICD